MIDEIMKMSKLWPHNIQINISKKDMKRSHSDRFLTWFNTWDNRSNQDVSEIIGEC